MEVSSDKKFDIEELSIQLSIGMDSIVYLDHILSSCDNKEVFDKYLIAYEKEVKEHFDVKDKLYATLKDYIAFEKEQNLPINMGYRLLFKALKEY